MSRRDDAAQYAKGLFNVAVGDADPRQVGEELKAFAALLEAQPELRHVLVSAAIAPDRKLAVLRDLARLSPLSPVLEHFFALLVRRHGFGLLPDIAEAFETRLMHHLKVVSAEVTTAVPLSAGDQAALAKRFADATGKQVRVSTTVDPSIVGGVVTRIGSVVYDGSVRRQLERLREQFLERT
jgi:F-type H+-transporting ATPase subunit delta